MPTPTITPAPGVEAQPNKHWQFHTDLNAAEVQQLDVIGFYLSLASVVMFIMIVSYKAGRNEERVFLTGSEVSLSTWGVICTVMHFTMYIVCVIVIMLLLCDFATVFLTR